MTNNKTAYDYYFDSNGKCVICEIKIDPSEQPFQICDVCQEITCCEQHANDHAHDHFPGFYEIDVT